MHVQIPVTPWADDHRVPRDEAAILVSPDGFRPTDRGSDYDPAGYAAYSLVLGGVEVGCSSWRLSVEDGPFLLLTIEGVIRRDWDAFVGAHTLDRVIQGSGRIGWNSGGQRMEVMWAYPASRLIVAPTTIELVETDE